MVALSSRSSVADPLLPTLRQVTMKMLGRDALPKVPPMSAAEITRLRERVGVS